ncbi:MAG: MFS transporter [Spirochaetales bacterium]|nr:MFS transporter [Spirochaetales bacterium]
MKPKSLKLFLLFSFFLFSFFYNSIPPLMTTIQEVFILKISVSTIVPVILTTGFILSSLLSALIIVKIGLRVSLIIAILTGMSSCILCIVARELILFNTGIFLFGFGYGWGILSLTAAYAHLEKKLQNFGLLHACFGLGGILAPLFISFIFSFHIDFRGIFVIYFILFFFLCIFMLITKTPENTKYTSYSFKNIIFPLKNIIIISCLFIIFFYSGCEVGMVTWAGNMFKDLHHFPKEISVLFITFFWIFFTMGRLFTDFLYKKLGKINLVLFTCFPALAILFLLIFAGRISSVILFSVCAFFLAPVFPVVQKYTNSLIPETEIGLLNGFIYIFAGAGIMLMTSLMGIISEQSIRLGYIIPLTGFLCIIFILIFGIILVNRKKMGKTNRPE